MADGQHAGIELDGSHKCCSITVFHWMTVTISSTHAAECDLVYPTDEARCRIAASSDSGSNVAPLCEVDSDEAPSGEEGTDVVASDEIADEVAFFSDKVAIDAMPST